MKKYAGLCMMFAAVVVISGCGRQSTPSMMNTSLPQLANQMHLEQKPVEKVNKAYLSGVVDSYSRYGVDTLQIALAYDPESKTYDSAKAFNDLGTIKSTLTTMGVRSIKGEVIKQSGVAPTLMLSYDAVTAHAPAGCRNMPGFEDGLTDVNIADYRFGCSVDTMLANQIYRPTDLAGYDGHDAGDGKKAANTVEFYRQVTEDEAEGELDRIGRSEISGQ